jgi:hypothetical protein
MPQELATMDSEFYELDADEKRNVEMGSRRSVLDGDQSAIAAADKGSSPRTNSVSSVPRHRSSVMAKTPTKITHNEFDDEFDKVPAERKSSKAKETAT